MQALWDLKHRPTNFNFAAFLPIALTHGVTHIHFRYEGVIQQKKYPEEIAWNRFKHILKPLCDLAGVTHEKGPGGPELTFGHEFGDVEKAYRDLGRIWKYQPKEDSGERGYVTVTLRESFRNEYRNSSKDEWEKFVDYLNQRGKNVVVLPDCEGNPLPISERMSLYAYADMNLGVGNGPLALCHFSDAPYIVFHVPWSHDAEGRRHEEMHDKTGFPRGSQFSFQNPRQLNVWGTDSFENIVKHYEEMCDRG
jgi:hypothetical protein